MDNNDFFKDKRKRSADEKPRGERPARRDFGDKPRSDRDSKPRFGDGERPARRDFGDKPRSDRDSKPRRDDSQRKPFSGNNERRSYNPNFTSDNKPRFEKRDDKPRREGGFGDKPRYGEKPKFGDRPPRREGGFGDRDKPRRDFGDKPRFEKRDDRPKRDFEDKPRRDFGGKPEKTQVHGEFKDGTYPTFEAPKPTTEIRLNRHIATSGRCSRRDADLLIKAGNVTVNDEIVTEMGAKIQPTDVVKIDGEVIGTEKKVYILMNKPKGFVTSLEDPHAEKTVIDLLGVTVRERVYPVGRLDKGSVGVLLLTNDGDLTSRLTHPSHNKKKIYQVTLDSAMTHADMQQIIDGMTLEDGPIAADAADWVSESKKEVGIEIHSGRNRVVRRMFEHLGYKVTKLDRVYFAGLTKRNLKRGQWRFLTATEVEKLLNNMYE